MSTNSSASIEDSFVRRHGTGAAGAGDGSPGRRSTRRRWAKWGLVAAASAVLLTGLIGVMHLPFAAPVLRAIMPGSVCPIMRGTPGQIDRAHALGAAAIRAGASSPAPVRAALSFQLDRTIKADVAAWAAVHGVSCSAIAMNDNLQRCINVPPAAVGQPAELGVLEEITFEFQASGALVNVQTLRRRLGPIQAARIAGRLEQSVASALGAPSTVGGEPTATHLGRGALASYEAVHLFTDYRATVSATNLAPTGVMVREEYLSLR